MDVDAGEHGAMTSSFLAIPATGKFHRVDCPMIEHLEVRFLREFESDLQAFDHGYEPAQCCATYDGPIRQWVLERPLNRRQDHDAR